MCFSACAPDGRHRWHLITQSRQLLAQMHRDDAFILHDQNRCWVSCVDLFLLDREPQREASRIGALNLDRAAELVSEHRDELQSKCLRLLEI